MRRSGVAALLLALLMSLARPSLALQQRLSRRELAARADHVVAAQVVSSQAHWRAGGQEIATRVELDVLARHKGALPAHAALLLEGGRIGAAQVWVEDVPWLQPGARYALFLVDTGRERWQVLGGLQGVVRLRDDGTGPGERWSDVVASLGLDLYPAPSVGEQPPVRTWFSTNGQDWSYQADPVEEPFSINLASFGLDAAALLARFEAALAVWNQESGAQLWLRSGGDTPVLQFGGVDDDHNVLMGEPYHFGSTLSVARYRSLGDQMLDCDVRFYARNLNGDIAWSVNPDGAAEGEHDLQHTMTHELGHCLGLSHSDVDGAIMWPTVGSGTGDERRHLHTDDIAGIQSLYGVRSSWPDAGAGLDAVADAGWLPDAAGPARDGAAADPDAGGAAVDAAELDATGSDAAPADVRLPPADATAADQAPAAACGCQAGRAAHHAAALLLVALGLGWRRHGRACSQG
jgi:hypothetical protein